MIFGNETYPVGEVMSAFNLPLHAYERSLDFHCHDRTGEMVIVHRAYVSKLTLVENSFSCECYNIFFCFPFGHHCTNLLHALFRHLVYGSKVTAYL